MKQTRIDSNNRFATTRTLNIIYTLTLLTGCPRHSNVKKPDTSDMSDTPHDLSDYLAAGHTVDVKHEDPYAFLEDFDYLETQRSIISCLKSAGHSIASRSFQAGYTVISTACQPDDPEATFYIVRFEGIRCANGGNTIQNPCRVRGSLVVNACKNSRIPKPNEHDLFLIESIDNIIHFYTNISSWRWERHHRGVVTHGSAIRPPDDCSNSSEAKRKGNQ